ncbi:ABC transporter transmembrane domain-containing protein [Clavibacter tessellarius]|uniref:ABC transporter transmembrane domain-containing protein n=1 Tax=Clavibacter tessellarius TaxID=31965 RepID=UPI0039BF509D
MLGLVVVSALVRGLAGWLLDVVGARGAAQVVAELRRRALRAIVDLGPAWTARRSRARVATVIGPGLDALDPYFARYVPQLILTALATPIVVAVLLLADPLTGVTVLVTLPVIPVFMVLVGWATQEVQRRQWARLTELASGFLDVVDGLSTLLVFGRARRQTARIRRVTEEHRVETMRVLRISFLSGFVLELAASLSVALVAVSVGVRLIGGQLDLEVGLFVLLLAPEAFLPIRQVGVQFHAAAEGSRPRTTCSGSSTRSGWGGRPAPREPQPLPLRGRRGTGRAPRPARWLRATRLVIRDLVVAHGDRCAVDRFTARLPRGRVTAVTGPSGAGKSSLLAAVLGQLPASGGIGWADRDAAAGTRARSGRSRPRRSPGPDSGRASSRARCGRTWRWASRIRTTRSSAARSPSRPQTTSTPTSRSASAARASRAGRPSGSPSRAPCTARSPSTARSCSSTSRGSALDADAEERLARGIRTLADQGRAVVVVTHRPALVAAADQELRLEAPGSAAARRAPDTWDAGLERAGAAAPALTEADPARPAPEPAWRAQVAP